jgi:hypothetical protein
MFRSNNYSKVGGEERSMHGKAAHIKNPFNQIIKQNLNIRKPWWLMSA